ncbi:hypothetical protein GCM10027432_09780 [Lysobacter fragariae]
MTANFAVFAYLLLPLFFLAEVISFFRTRAVERILFDEYPRVAKQLGYSDSDGAYRHQFRTTYMLPFSPATVSLPERLRREIRFLAVFRIVSIAYFLVVVCVTLADKV